tara:strand:+ start:522 stop:3059 length:2538 start_codon:yes stop_codon:yes gene_type:complete
MKKSILLDKNKFNFLLERIENKYSYDEFKELSKGLLVESYRTKILKAISGIDESTLLKKLKGAGLAKKEIDDVFNGIEFIKKPNNVSNHGFAPLIISDEWVNNIQKGFDLEVLEIKSMKNGFKQLSDIHNSKISSIQNNRNPVLQYVLDSNNLNPDEQISNIAGILEDYPDFFDDAIDADELKFSSREGSSNTRKKLKNQEHFRDWIYDNIDDGSAGPGSPSKLIDKKTRGEWKSSKTKYNKSKSQHVSGSDGGKIDPKDLGGTEETGPMKFKKKVKKFFKWAAYGHVKQYWNWVIYGGKKGKMDAEKWFSKRSGKGFLNAKTSGDPTKGIQIGTWRVTVANVVNATVSPMLRGLVAHPFVLVAFIAECVNRLGWSEDKIMTFENALDNNGEPKTIAIPFKWTNCLGQSSVYINEETGKIETYNPMMFPLFKWTPTSQIGSAVGISAIGLVTSFLEPLNPMVSQVIQSAQDRIDKLFADKGFLELLHMECTEEDIKKQIDQVMSKVKSIGDNMYIRKFFAKWTIGFDLNKMSEEDTTLFLEVLGSVDAGVESFKNMKKGIDPYLPEGEQKESVSLGDLLMAYCNKKRIELLVKTSGEVTHKLSNIVIHTEVSKNKNEVLCEEFKLWKKLSCTTPTDLDNCVPKLTECNNNKDLMQKVISMTNKDPELSPEYTNTLFDIQIWEEGCKKFNNHYNADIGDWVCNIPEGPVDIVFEMEYEDIIINTNALKYKYSWETELEVYGLNADDKKVRKNKIDTCNGIQNYANMLNTRNFKNKGVPLFSDKVAWKNEYGETMYDIKANNEVLKEFQSHFCVVGKINDPQSTVEQCKSELKTIFDGLTCSGAQKL